MATKIESVSAVIGRSRVPLSVTKGKSIKHLEIKLSNGIGFDVEVDAEGDIIITADRRIKILREEENELTIGIKKPK